MLAVNARLFHDRAMPTSANVWWVYLLACADGRMYAGIALDVEVRFQRHRSGKGAKFTRANPPQRILGAQSFATRSAALKAEYALKQLDREAKVAWARSASYPEAAPAE